MIVSSSSEVVIESAAITFTPQHEPKPRAALDPLGIHCYLSTHASLQYTTRDMAMLSTFKPSRSISSCPAKAIDCQFLPDPPHFSTAAPRLVATEQTGCDTKRMGTYER